MVLESFNKNEVQERLSGIESASFKSGAHLGDIPDQDIVSVEVLEGSALPTGLHNVPLNNSAERENCCCSLNCGIFLLNP